MNKIELLEEILSDIAEIDIRNMCPIASCEIGMISTKLDFLRKFMKMDEEKLNGK